MRIESLEIIISPSYRKPDYQEFYFKCIVNGKAIETQEIFERHDLRSIFDRMLDLARLRVKQVLEMDEELKG